MNQITTKEKQTMLGFFKRSRIEHLEESNRILKNELRFMRNAVIALYIQENPIDKDELEAYKQELRERILRGMEGEPSAGEWTTDGDGTRRFVVTSKELLAQVDEELSDSRSMEKSFVCEKNEVLRPFLLT